MKFYEPGSAKRIVALVAIVFVLSLYLMSLPRPTYIPDEADPQTLYHTVWQVVSETFYDKSKLQDWGAWEHRYDGKLKTPADAEKAIDEMLASLDDRFTYFLDPQSKADDENRRQGEFVGVGIGFRLGRAGDGKLMIASDGNVMPGVGTSGLPLIQDVVAGSPAAYAGIKVGDEIEAVNGVSVRGRSMQALISMMRGPKGTEVTIAIRRNSVALVVVITRDVIRERLVADKMLANDIGYIKLKSFGPDNIVNELIAAVKRLSTAKGLILDLRDNPGGQVVNAIKAAAVFLDRGVVVVTKTREDGRVVESEYALSQDELVIATMKAKDDVLLVRVKRPVDQQTNVPMIVLVNGNSASASEMLAGALQDNRRAIVVGEKSFGKGIGQSLIAMPNGTVLHVTAMRYYTPSMRWVGDGTGVGLFAMGIIPDVPVASRGSLILDLQLEAGQRELLKMIDGKK